MTSPTSKPTPSSVLNRPDWLRARYDRLVLVSHPDHLAGLALDSQDQLIVSTDFLVWHRLKDQGAHVLHLEAFQDTWPDADLGPPETFHQRVCEWVYDEAGRDMTRILGMSIGKCFVRDVSQAAVAYGRAWHGLGRAIHEFLPKSVVLFDLYSQNGLMNGAMKRHLVASVAKANGVAFEDRLAPPPLGDRHVPEKPDGYGAPVVETGWRVGLRNAYGRLIDIASGLRWRLAGKPPTVYLLSNWSSVSNLLDHWPGGRLVPMVMASMVPKKPATVAGWIGRGVRLASLSDTRPDHRLTADIAAAIKTVEDHWERRPAITPLDQAIRIFIATNIFASGWFQSVAAEAAAWHSTFCKNKLARAVIGDVTGGMSRMVIEAARASGASIDELPNGMFTSRQRYDARNGDSHGKPVVDRLLAWGPQQQAWAAAAKLEGEVVVTGYPALDGKRDLPHEHPNPKGNALVLPVYADADDVLAFHSNIFASLVDTLTMLGQIGCQNIRVKLHGGPQNLSYYKQVADLAGVSAEIVKGGAIEPYLKWADFVVGPVNSGAIAETAASGVPYFAYRPEPTLIDRALLSGLDTFSTAAEIKTWLEESRLPSPIAMASYLEGQPLGTSASDQFWALPSDEARA